MLTETISHLKKLPLAKKRRVVEALIADIYGSEVTQPEIVGALESRMAHYRKNPPSARSWAAVKSRLLRAK